MKILLNRAPVNGPWGGGNNFVKAFFEFAPSFGVTVGTKLNILYDGILMIDPRPDELGVGLAEILRYKSFQPKCKIFQRVNECDARKATTDVDAMLNAASAANDHTFFVSNWMLRYHTSKDWKCGSISVVYNGVDKTVFKPRNKLNNGKTNIVTHHWSDNPYKGEDVHRWLDQFVKANPQFTYTYIGRTQIDLPNSKIIEPLWGMALGEELSKYDVYVTGTVQDPGPNHIIEALACGIPSYAHFRGGGACEFVGNEHVYDNVPLLEEFLRSDDKKKNLWTPEDWKVCVGEYISKMKEVINV